MMPVLLYSKTMEGADVYINAFIKEHQVPPHFVFRVRPLKTELGIDQIRDIKRELMTVNTERLIILYAFETASIEAQNALLKTLEEQSEHNQFILVTTNIERVLPTVRSRSRVVYGARQETQVRPETVTLYQSVTSGTYEFLAHSLVTGIDRDGALRLMDECISLMRRDMAVRPTLTAAMKYILLSKDLMQSNNLNPQMAIDSVLLHVRKAYLSP